MLLITLLLTYTAAAQNSPAAVTADLAYRIEATFSSKFDLPAGTKLKFERQNTSEIPGYDRLDITYSAVDGRTGTIPMLISKDGSKLAQFTTYNIELDPNEKFSVEGRPARGGLPNAPVLIVIFDDLECPFCAHLHAELFPRLLDRYKDQIRVVYRNFPIEGHPWAMHAAVDTDCLGAQSSPSYWAAVDNIHAHASEYGGGEHSLAKAQEEIDSEIKKRGQIFHLDESKLDACIAKQDQTTELASLLLGRQLGVASTPTLFINGVKVVGATPLENIFALIDDALRAKGQTPPPPYNPDSSRLQLTPKR